MKIVSSKEGIRSPGFHKKKQREKNIRITLWTLFLIFIIGIPIYLLKQERFLISTIQIQGNEVTKSDEIENIARQGLADKYLWLIPRSSALLYPKNKIKKAILEEIPRLLSLDLSLVNSRTLVATIVEREPFALYCAEADCFFLDHTGYIFSEAPAFSDGVYIIYSRDPALESPLGGNLLSEEDFIQVSNFLESLKTMNILSKTLLIRDDEYHITLPAGGVITWKASADPELIRSSLEAFLSDRNITQGKNTLEKLLYVDLRFGNKIFYKFR